MNFSALDGYKQKSDNQGYYKAIFWLVFGPIILLIIAFIIGGVVGKLLELLDIEDADSIGFVIGFISFFILSIIGIAVAVIKAFGRKQDTAIYLNKFASDNGLVYEDKRSQDKNSITVDKFSGSILGLPYTLSKKQVLYEMGEIGDDYTEFEVSLPKSFPHLVVDAKVETSHLADEITGAGASQIFNNSKETTSDGQHFARSGVIRKDNLIILESYFGDFFHLYASEQDRVEVLAIITPDVMQAIKDSYAYCDIELSASTLRFVWPEWPRDKQDFINMYATVDQILKQLYRKLTGQLLGDAVQSTVPMVGASDKGKYRPYKAYLYIIGLLFTIAAIHFNSGPGGLYGAQGGELSVVDALIYILVQLFFLSLLFRAVIYAYKTYKIKRYRR